MSSNESCKIQYQRTKKARTKLCVFASEVFDYLAPNIRVKPTPDGVSVIALLLVPSESVEVSEARIKAKRFSNMSKMCVSAIR